MVWSQQYDATIRLDAEDEDVGSEAGHPERRDTPDRDDLPTDQVLRPIPLRHLG